MSEIKEQLKEATDGVSANSMRKMLAFADKKCPLCDDVKQYKEALNEFMLNQEASWVKEREDKQRIREANAGRLTWGKYKGKLLKDILLIDKPYCKWMMSKKKDYLSKDLLDELEKAHL